MTKAAQNAKKAIISIQQEGNNQCASNAVILFSIVSIVSLPISVLFALMTFSPWEKMETVDAVVMLTSTQKQVLADVLVVSS